MILLTHPDLDHIGGIATVHRAFPRAKIAMSEVFRDSEQVTGMMQEARISADNLIWLPPKCESHFGRMTLTWFAPHLSSRVGDNDHSVVVKVQEGRSTALLTGDSGFPEEGELLAQDEDWKVDVLKAGHHGSKNSTSPRWLAACQPKFLAISCGLNNSYGHPHPYVLSRAEDAHAKVVRTDREGEIRFRATETGFQLVR
jgi:competence protein ComEC